MTRWSEPILKATHGSADHPLRIGNLEIPCYVLEDGRRVLSLGGMLKAMGMSIGSAGGGDGDRLVSFAAGKAISPFISSDLMTRMKSPKLREKPRPLGRGGIASDTVWLVVSSNANPRRSGGIS